MSELQSETIQSETASSGYFRHQLWKNKQTSAHRNEWGCSFKPAYAQEAYLIEQNIQKYHCKSIILIYLTQNVIPFDHFDWLDVGRGQVCFPYKKQGYIS